MIESGWMALFLTFDPIDLLNNRRNNGEIVLYSMPNNIRGCRYLDSVDF